MQKLLHLITFTVFIFSFQPASAQNNYSNHTLKEGETLSQLANEYNTNVGDIMRINGMHADSKLIYGSQIKIPSDKKIHPTTENRNLSVQANKQVSGTLTHKVSKGETLFSISKHYNVSVQQIKAWNNITGNSAKLGSILVVGNNAVEETNKTFVGTGKKRVEIPSQTIAQSSEEIKPKNENDNNVVENDTANIFINKASNIDTLKTNNETSVVTDNVEPSLNALSNKEGYFADSFKKSRKQEHVSGISKTFKTASGWNDGKYYILADDINPGTIVKLTADNGNAVYAKVLWNMGSLKENNGINFRVSNATAAALNENTDSFNLNIYY